MTIKASGSISFSDIANEFGTPPNRNLGAYRVSQTIGELVDFPLDTGIPQSGIVSFSTFYSKKLNVVVNCGSGSRINARTLYDDATVGIVSAIGGYRIRPASSSGSKVWIHVSGTIAPNLPSSYSVPNNIYCSLLTGNWDNDTDLRLDIGPSGLVRGIGGFGGYPQAAGGPGTSAIGVTTSPISIVNRGTILRGTGGGGGGGNSSRGLERPMYASGGSGGGGRPFGSPGATLFDQGPGNPGQYVTDDIGGAENPNFRTLTGGRGGDGGQFGGSGSSSGTFPTTNEYHGPGGPPGDNGYAFVISTNESGVTIDLGANTDGSVIYNTNPS